MSSEKFIKTLPPVFVKAGLGIPTAFQSQTYSVINSGSDLFASGPEGCGKTTAIAMTIVRKLKAPVEVAPRALVVVNDTDAAKEMTRIVGSFARESGLRVVCVHENSDVEDQVDELYEGSDIVIATPKRLALLFLRNWINLNKLQQMFIDDAQLLIKNGHKQSIDKVAVSLPKCQRVVFATEMNDRMRESFNQLVSYAKIVSVE